MINEDQSHCSSATTIIMDAAGNDDDVVLFAPPDVTEVKKQNTPMSLFASPRSPVDLAFFAGSSSSEISTVLHVPPGGGGEENDSGSCCNNGTNDVVIEEEEEARLRHAPQEEFKFPSLFTYGNHHRPSRRIPSGPHQNEDPVAVRRSALTGDIGTATSTSEFPLMMIRGPPRIRQVHAGNPFFAPVCDLDENDNFSSSSPRQEQSQSMRPRRLMRRNNTSSSRSLFQPNVVRPPASIVKRASSPSPRKVALLKSCQQQEQQQSGANELVKFQDLPPLADGRVIHRPIARRRLVYGNENAVADPSLLSTSTAGNLRSRTHFQSTISSPFRRCSDF
uniref:Uncharacterized protein n=1 Tax=Leptocylindrus danicus TaxID=163516 RepID=A0A7S2KWQ2_9STRA